jgi:D-amino-acid oxidase
LKIAIVGSGVIGLSVACRLASAGHQLTIISGQPSSETTSAVSAAYWGPYFVGHYHRSWAIETWRELYQIASNPELARQSGTSIVEFREWLGEEDQSKFEEHFHGSVKHVHDPAEVSLKEAEPYWWRELPGIDFQRSPLVPSQVIHFPDMGDRVFTSQLQFRSVVARMPDYLRFLQMKAESFRPIAFEHRWIDGFSDLLGRHDFVINCTGWGAKRLVQEDPSTARMRLLAGLVVRVEASNQSFAFSLGHGVFAKEPLYIVPRQGSRIDSICGGTAIEIHGDVDPRNPFPMEIDERCDKIYRRCVAASDSIRDGNRCENLAGLRPMRDAVRIEHDPMNARLIHCYGHGGSGLTLSWGSANRVAELIG